MENMVMFGGVFKNKKILITGNTGFKGSWLTLWLLKMDAQIIGFSNGIPTAPSLFEILELEKKIKHYNGDIVNLQAISSVIVNEKPDFVFHLAAQAVVSVSYISPIDTICANTLGTANILEALRLSNHKCNVVLITSDKVYDNIEQVWGYKENDILGGKDIYSGSKAAAELIIKSYFHSFFQHDASNVKIAIARAGNVIGGGDWTIDRIVVDCMKSWSKNEPVKIRNPHSTRPWQHVLEPLSGYLTLAYNLAKNNDICGEAFNFGPNEVGSKTVLELLRDIGIYWSKTVDSGSYEIQNISQFHEAKLLKLNCDKAAFYLQWKPALNYAQTVEFTSLWYYNFYNTQNNMQTFTLEQIKQYENIANTNGLVWTK